MSDTDAAQATRAVLERLLAAEPELAGRLPEGYAAAAERFVALLLEANRRINLTRIVEPGEVAQLHLLDALAALPLLDEAAPSSVVDLGSGGGIPAIPLALARPGIEWLLVESVARKGSELRSFVGALGLRHVRVVTDRAESFARSPEHRERHDLVTARACAALPVLVELALPCLRTGGALVAWKGPAEPGDPELARGAEAAAQLGGAQPEVVAAGPPALGGHRFVVVRKAQPTPDRFPRRPGVAARRPLA